MRPIHELLREGVEAGQFGGEIEPHGDHAMGFVSFLENPEFEFVGHVVDIGSGAGLPALILIEAFPQTEWTLIERRQGRADLLRRAVQRLGFRDRVDVLSNDAVVAASGALRASADWVTARSFGPPADTAECATAFLRSGGQLVVSEPLDGIAEKRWPAEGLDLVDLTLAEDWEYLSGRYLRFSRGNKELLHLPRRGSRKRLLF